jgi:benzoyl-CoA reductase subunit B
LTVTQAAAKSDYQGRIHNLQKDMIGRYYSRLTAAAENKSEKAIYMLVSGNPVELIEAFDMIPVYPEVNALQLAVKKQSLPLILAAEEMGYSTDNCAYVKADAPIYNLDVPFFRSTSGEPFAEDVQYVVKQLEEVIEVLERMSGKKLDYKKLQRIVALSGETGALWSEIKKLAQNRPTPFDAYFDSVMMMAPLYCLRGTEDGLWFFQEAYKEMKKRADNQEGPLPEEKFRVVMEGPPPWPYLRQFRDMFSRWGAVAVASTYSTVGGIWEFGFRHDPNRPLESIARHMLQWNLTNTNFLERYRQIKEYVKAWKADALVIHSVKSCRLFSAGQGDMREYFTKELNIPTLLIESDIEDPRYFSEAQLRNRVDAFFESLEHQRMLVQK